MKKLIFTLLFTIVFAVVCAPAIYAGGEDTYEDTYESIIEDTYYDVDPEDTNHPDPDELHKTADGFIYHYNVWNVGWVVIDYDGVYRDNVTIPAEIDGIPVKKFFPGRQINAKVVTIEFEMNCDSRCFGDSVDTVRFAEGIENASISFYPYESLNICFPSSIKNIEWTNEDSFKGDFIYQNLRFFAPENSYAYNRIKSTGYPVNEVTLKKPIVRNISKTSFDISVDGDAFASVYGGKFSIGIYDIKAEKHLKKQTVDCSAEDTAVTVKGLSPGTTYKITLNKSLHLLFGDIQAETDFIVRTLDTTAVIKENNSKKANLTKYIMTVKTNINLTYGTMGKWAHVSYISQFIDNNNRISFAYGKDDGKYVYIEKISSDLKTSTTLKIKKRYPKLGAVTCDDKGNFYIIWGEYDKDGKGGVETIAISKYNNKGKFIKTMAIKSSGDGGLGSNDTRIPFDAGNCAVVIDSGVLICSYAREMYNGHQSNAIIAVNIDDMSRNEDYYAYTSHSFDQRVMVYEKGNAVIFADHGDAYDRGFCITVDGEIQNYLVPFNFYVEPHYWDNMFLLNYTNAQLGGIGETSAGLALVGSSAKSYSPSFTNEKMQLFIQIFDPMSSNYSNINFTLKGSTRYNPDGEVVDKNVKWLTNYKKDGVENPQMVVTDDDRIVIMWERHSDSGFVGSYYMILSANGTVLKKATSMGQVRLNSCEEPYYVNDSVYWVTVPESGVKEAVINKLKV